MTHSLLLFAILVLVAQIAGKLDATTALGAQLFFWRGSPMRWSTSPHPVAAHAVWAVSVIGLVMIFIRVI